MREPTELPIESVRAPERTRLIDSRDYLFETTSNWPQAAYPVLQEAEAEAPRAEPARLARNEPVGGRSGQSSMLSSRWAARASAVASAAAVVATTPKKRC